MSELLRTESSADEVLRKYANTVFRLAFSRTGNRQDAEDVMQEVFLTYVRKLPVFKDEEHEKAWFLRVTVNEAITLETSSWHKKRAALNDDIPVEDIAEKSSGVLEAVMILPPKYRTVIELFYYEDMTVEQIGSVTGQTRGAVKTQLNRARDILRSILKEDEGYV